MMKVPKKPLKSHPSLHLDQQQKYRYSYKLNENMDKIRKITVQMAKEGRATFAMAAQQRLLIAKGNEIRYERHRSMCEKYDNRGYDGDHEIT